MFVEWRQWNLRYDVHKIDNTSAFWDQGIEALGKIGRTGPWPGKSDPFGDRPELHVFGNVKTTEHSHCRTETVPCHQYSFRSRAF